MGGNVCDLRWGDVLMLDNGSEWRIERAEVVRDGVRLFLVAPPRRPLRGNEQIVCLSNIFREEWA
jgi:hypothetical protein